MTQTLQTHNSFLDKARLLFRDPGQLHDIIALTRLGVAPEGAKLGEQTFNVGSLIQATDGKAMTAAKPSGFTLGAASLKNLDGVLPQLAEVVKLAITLTQQDFTVYEGLRTIERQKKLVQQGFSKTLQSMHLPQADKYGHAVDLVPWIQGHPVWDWHGCFLIANAMDEAATQLGCADRIVWGAAWDRRLSDYGGDVALIKQAVEDYKARHKGADFLDGPHFEWRS